MLAVLGDYLKNLGSEIKTYEQLIAQKREEIQKLTQLQGQVVEALGLLKDIVDELSLVDPDAITTIQAVALQIFDNNRKSPLDVAAIQNGNGSIPSLSQASAVHSDPIEIPELETLSSESPFNAKKSHEIRLSQNVIYQPDNAIAYAGINSYNRSKAWGEWLCLTHAIGDRFEIHNQSRSESYNYDLVIFDIKPEDAQRLADTNLANQPDASDNTTWQPPKRISNIEQPQSFLCKTGNLAIGDTARTKEGKEYRIIEVSDDGSVAKVFNEENLEIALFTEDLSAIKKAESELNENLEDVKEAFSKSNDNLQGWEVGNAVRINSNRYKNQYNGQTGAIATEPSNFGLKVNLGDEKPIFFLKDEVILLD